MTIIPETETSTEIPLPLAIRQLIQLHNDKVREYQQVALNDIQRASIEIMNILGLRTDDGWRLDIDGMKFVKVPTEQPTDGNT